MSYRITFILAVTVAIMSIFPLKATAVGTSFTYQGQLKSDGKPVTGPVDFEFSLWDASSNGTQIGSMLTLTGVEVENGLFDVLLDFGPFAFTGADRWVEISIRSPSGAGGFTTLEPRQELTPVPYAFFSNLTNMALTIAPPVYIEGAFNDPVVGVFNTGTGDGLFAGIGPAASLPANGGGNAIYLLARSKHALFATDADVAAPAGDDLLVVNVSQPARSAIVAQSTNAGNNTSTIVSNNSGNGNAVKATVSGTGDAVKAYTSSTGSAVHATSTAAGNALFAGTGVAPLNPVGNGNSIYSLAPGGHALFATDSAIAAPAGNDVLVANASQAARSAIVARSTNAANNTATITSTNSGNGNAVKAYTSGTGSAVHATNTAAGNALFAGVGLAPLNPVGNGNAIYSLASNGHALFATDSAISAPAGDDVVAVSATGLGKSAISASTTDAANNRSTIVSSNTGTRHAIEATNTGTGKGVSGTADDDDGVYGKTNKTGTFIYGNSSIVAGVQGSSAEIDSVDNFGVAGIASGYGTGVLGVGNGSGQGVLGVCGNEPGFVNAGVRGVTRESQSGSYTFPPYFALKTSPDKDMVGVLGQSATRVGVWGESLERIGIVGSSGDELSLTQVPNKAIGVYGVASQDGGFGLVGKSQSVNTNGAGVKAIGNGNDGASALIIDNGSITVTGECKPAGSVVFGGPWSHLSGCAAVVGPVAGFYTDSVVSNGLIEPTSIIMLTVESPGLGGDPEMGLYPQVLIKTTGSMTVRICALGPEINGDGVCNGLDVAAMQSLGGTVNYLIINQE